MNKAIVLCRLVVAHNLTRWGRALLGIAGIAAAVCLVVCIFRGYETAASSQATSARDTSGRFDVTVSPPMPRVFPGGGRGRGGGPPAAPSMDATPKFVDAGLIEQMRKDSSVERVVPMISQRVRVIDPPAKVQMGPFGGGSMVGTEDDAPPRDLSEGRWLKAGAEGDAVISGGFASRHSLTLGAGVTVAGLSGQRRLKVVGVLGGGPGGGGPRPMGPSAMGDLYVALGDAGAINGFTGRANLVAVVLKNRDQAGAFAETWTGKTAAIVPPVTVRSLRQQEDDGMGGRMMMMVQAQAQNAMILGFLAAGFIIFATLNAGMRERRREWASLRAVALSRSQLVFMVFLEAFLLTAVGWGAGLLATLGLYRPVAALAVSLDLLQPGPLADSPLSGTCVWVSGLCALAGSLAAAILPAIQALRLKPMDILGGSGEAPPRPVPWLTVTLGLILVLAMPVAVLLANVEPFQTFFANTFKMGFGPPLLSCTAMIAGLALLCPGLLRLIEAVVGPALAMALRLDRRFLRQQFTGHLWRAVATTISLSAGLTLFVTSLVWGYSMLVPFTPDESLPRMLVSVLPAGVAPEALDEVGKTPGVIEGQCLAMAVEQPRLTAKMLDSKPFATVDASQQHLLLMGVDPNQALGGSKPVLGFTFVQGNREEAVGKLLRGRFCLVPDHFATQTGLGVGDRFSVEVPNAPGRSVEYEIAGVVYVPGWNWFTKFTEIRRRAGRALAMVFADYAQVRKDFRVDRINYFWMNVDADVTSQEIEARLAPLAQRQAGVVVEVPGVGMAKIDKQYIRITERGELKTMLNRRADSVILALTRLPLLALAIASLAVFNAVFASVRARFWQFGVLRGVGLSRWQLFRLVISESLMIFLAAGLLSLGAGVLLAWCGTHICTYFFYFAGHTPPLVLPWADLAPGFAIAFGLCFLAGLIPAWRAARQEPLKFIQGGRLAA